MDRNRRWLVPLLGGLLLCAVASVCFQYLILKELMVNDSTEATVDGDMVVPVERLPGETDLEYVGRVVAAVLTAGGEVEGDD